MTPRQIKRWPLLVLSAAMLAGAAFAAGCESQENSDRSMSSDKRSDVSNRQPDLAKTPADSDTRVRMEIY